LKRVTLTAPLDLLALDLLQQQALFFFVQRVEHLLAHVDAEQRRHRHEDVAGGDQRRKCLRNSADSRVAMCRPSESASARITTLP
jgi:hypothetical protein